MLMEVEVQNVAMVDAPGSRSPVPQEIAFGVVFKLVVPFLMVDGIMVYGDVNVTFPLFVNM